MDLTQNQNYVIRCKYCFAKLGNSHRDICRMSGVVTNESISIEKIEVSNIKPSSSKVPPLNLIPFSTLECLAARFQLGQETKKNPWNATSNVGAAQDVEFVRERLVHVICHAFAAIEKLSNGGDWESIYGDAGAILFGGSLLAEYLKQTKKVETKE